MKIVYIIGRSGSGKDTIKSILLRSSDLDLKPLVEVTTRPMRENEVDGVEHVFINDTELDGLKNSNRIIESRSYKTACGDIWSYATLVPDEVLSNNIYVGTGSLESYLMIKEKYPEDVIPILLWVDDYNLILRSINREHGGSRDSLKEICRRFISDAEDYSDEKINASGISKKNIVKNTESLSSTVSKIKAIILRSTRKERGI